jgi:hypothetical protein
MTLSRASQEIPRSRGQRGGAAGPSRPKCHEQFRPQAIAECQPRASA